MSFSTSPLWKDKQLHLQHASGVEKLIIKELWSHRQQARNTEWVLTVQWSLSQRSRLLVYRRVQELGDLHWRNCAVCWRTAPALLT